MTTSCLHSKPVSLLADNNELSIIDLSGHRTRTFPWQLWRYDTLSLGPAEQPVSVHG